MARTFLRQASQIRNSLVYDDTVAPTEAAFETNPTEIETDLNNMRSALKSLMGTANWWNTVTRPIQTLNTDLADVEGKKLLFRATILTDVSVTAAQNWEILSVAGSEAPSQTAAIATTQNGAVVAKSALSGVGFNVHELIEIAPTGGDVLHPKNLCIVRDATTGQIIESGGKDVFALLQTESNTADGDAFDDVADGSGKRVKLSFVIPNAGFTDLIACPVADIAGKTINYAYVRRLNFDGILEDAYLTDAGFVDQIASVDVTLDNAIDNQGTTPATQATNIDIDIAADKEWFWRDKDSADLFGIIEGATGGDTTVQLGVAVDVFDSNAILNDFANSIKVNTGGTTINIGVTASQIDSAASLALKATGAASDLLLEGGREVLFDDANLAGSAWGSASIKFSDTSAEWTSYIANFGDGTSVIAAINAAYEAVGSMAKVYANVVANADENTDIYYNGGAGKIDTALGDLSGGTFIADHDVYLNGQFLRLGADLDANHDVYPGTDLDNSGDGMLKFEFKLKIGDVLAVVSRA